MTTSRLVKTIIFILLLVAASSYLGSVGRQIGQLGDALLDFSIETLYSLLWLLLALMSVAIAGGLVAVLVRPLRICFIGFGIASLALLFFWGLNLVAAALAALYLVAGLLFSRGVAKGLDERIRFSVRPIEDNQTPLAIVLVIAVCVLFYVGYSNQIESEGFTMPPFVMNMAVTTAQKQLGMMPGLTLEQQEQALTEFKQLFEQQVEDAVKPYQQLIPIAVAIILFGILTAIIRLFSWLPSLILKAIFHVLTTYHVTTVVTQTREIERLTID